MRLKTLFLFVSKVVGVVEGELCAEHGLLLANRSDAQRSLLPDILCIVMLSNAQLAIIANILKKNLMSKNNE